VGSKIIGKSFRSTIEKSIKNPLVGAIGEVIEESAVEFGNQANDTVFVQNLIFAIKMQVCPLREWAEYKQ
jgi:hypothetical protein